MHDLTTFDDLRAARGVVISGTYGAYAATPPLPPSAWLLETLRRGRLKATRSNTAPARAAWLVAPVLAELEDRLPGVAVFSGVPIGGTVTPDFVIAAHGPSLCPPVHAVVVQARRGDGERATVQCVLALQAARARNGGEAAGGVVTDGVCWQFVRLAGERAATVDEQIWTLEAIPTILGVLRAWCAQ